MGTINTPVQLTIRASVKAGDFNIGHTVQTITNNATISWDERAGSIGSGSINVNIGLNPISKSSGTYNRSTHSIPWNVTVEKSDVDVDLYVLDLLVYGSSGFNWTDIDSISVSEGVGAGLSLLDLATIKLRDPKPQYNQKYSPGSFGNSLAPSLERVVYTLRKGGVAVADLLVVTEAAGAGINVTGGDKKFSFKTIVTNPEVYAANVDRQVHNTAVLYSADSRLNESTASVTTNSRMLVKDMLTRVNAADPDTNRNGAGATAGAGYNYTDHSVVFRLHINSNSLTDFTNDITTVDGQLVGNVTLTDTLPAGWEFVDIHTDQKFLIFEGTSVSGGKVTAGAVPADTSFLTSDFNTAGVAEFTFTKLDKPYVILLKAKPTAATIEDYFSKNRTYNPINTATLSAEKWAPGVSNTQTVTIKSEILSKELAIGTGLEQGVLTRTVEYKPNKIERTSAVIEDTLPVGLDLRTDANGQLLIDGNISAIKLLLKTDGTYSDGALVPLVLGVDVIYDNEARVLQFNIPEPAQAYRLTYKTDVTGNPGESLTNTVKLTSATANQDNVKAGYTVATADASATMQRSGWLEITKLDAAGNAPIEGVKFALYTADETTIIRSGVTNASGKLTLRGLPLGSYVLKEIESAAGYDELNKTYEVIVEKQGDKLVTRIGNQTGDDSNKITVVNYKTGTVGDLTVSKTIAGGAAEPLKEFNFTVTITGVTGKFEYLGAGGKADGVLELDANGSATFTLKGGESITIKNLPKDATYTVTEDDYRSERYTTTSVGSQGSIVADDVQTAAFRNTKYSLPVGPEMGSLELMKTDADNKALAGAEFTLYNNLGEVLQTAVSGADGLVRFNNVLIGHYTIRETKAPTGYEASTEVLTATVMYDGVVVRTTPYTVVNEKSDSGDGEGSGTIELMKTDAEGNPLLRAEFTLYDEDGEVVQVAYSDIDGLVRFEGVPLGSYTIKETVAPEGYDALDVIITAEIVVEDEIVQADPYTLVNTKADDPKDPEDPDKPTDPEEPAEPGKPGEPTDPAEPGKPGEPTDPTEPGKPGELPKAGGLLDTTVLAIGGILLILAGLGYAFRKRYKARNNIA